MCQGLNSHYFHIIRDGHQPKSVGLYIPIIRIPKGGRSPIPQKRDNLDHGTYGMQLGILPNQGIKLDIYIYAGSPWPPVFMGWFPSFTMILVGV